ncbi:MAG TPA: hypothetical protein VET89_00820 [Stellaceae bacterium]|jgi:hypothetical protein|nr:hypothetical protein [Stellaceae bacterium]
MTKPAIHSCRYSRARHGDGSTDHRIRAFLSGETHGEDVLNALYGQPLDEPIPQRLSDLLKR